MVTNLKTGVYRIININNIKCYIGSAAINFNYRWIDHKRLLANQRHHSIKLQYAWNKYGESSFVFEILEECKPEQCIEREQHYLDTLLFASCDNNKFNQLGYNICRVAGNTLGRKNSEVTRARISKANKGIHHYNYGGILSTEHKLKISNAMSGKNNHMFGKIRPEHSILISGKNNPRAKLNQRDADIIRNLIQQGISQRKIAKQFGVHQTTVSDINRGKIW